MHCRGTASDRRVFVCRVCNSRSTIFCLNRLGDRDERRMRAQHARTREDRLTFLVESLLGSCLDFLQLTLEIVVECRTGNKARPDEQNDDRAGDHRWTNVVSEEESRKVNIAPRKGCDDEHERERERDTSLPIQPARPASNDELIIIIVIHDVLDLCLSVSHLVSVL